MIALRANGKNSPFARTAVSRCIWILEALRAQPGIHQLPELMDALGVSRRTIARDLAALRDAGARIEHDRAHRGIRYVCFDRELACVRSRERGAA